jgi:hypothetical protein
VQLRVVSSGTASVSQAQSLWAEPTTGSSFEVSSYDNGQSVEMLGDSTFSNASTSGDTTNSFSFDTVDQFSTGTIYSVSLNAEATAGIDDGTQTASANVDPTFQIVGVSDPNDYSIVYGPGIGNLQSVPDAAETLGLLSLSLVTLGMVGLRKRISV